MSFKYFLILFSAILLFNSCGKQDALKPKRVKIKIAGKNKSLSAFSTLETDPANNNEINCAGIFVYYPEFSIPTFDPKCTKSNNAEEAFHEVSEVVQLTTGSGTIEMDIEIGTGRNFILFGFKSSGDCSGTVGEGTNSAPFILGKVTADIDIDSTSISLASETFNTDNKISSCDGGVYDYNSGGVSGPALMMYVTQSDFQGNLGGIAGADGLCMGDANHPEYPSAITTFKALLVDGTNRIACTTPFCNGNENFNWVLQPETTYMDLNNNVIGTTNVGGVFETNVALSTVAVWTGLGGSGSEWMTGDVCLNWSDNISELGGYGDTSIANYGAFGFAADTCSGLRNLICVEQPVR